ncbi:serine/threonine-protein kinase VRK2 isoform X2 [Esox lucius]|uniref:serine/threonine-protein kinase VRK2 isoform X2 n=1 Tax=Esox lucius TaxID=8010 RepID=UPI00147683FA|nr:serine/threonine-protein kinase VRK2 isoform X2 [Esox lucius]
MAPRKRPLPNPLPSGFILTDTGKKQWRLGQVIGQGGFGLIYLASQDLDMPVVEDSNYVIKVVRTVGQWLILLSTMRMGLCFLSSSSIRGQLNQRTRWKRTNKLDFLGIPTYWGSGQSEHCGTSYRFMVMDRLGSDLQKVCDLNGGRLKKHTVLQLGRGLLDVLEYIHDNEYVHADIKAANLMLGHTDTDKVYLADYGLSYRYSPDGVHKEYKENPKKGHNGTIEYTSIDAHKGVAPSRRGDLEVLGFCLLHWLCGSLPWTSVLRQPLKVLESKTRLMENLPGSVQQLSVGGASADELASFLLCVKTLGYKERPDYKKLRELLSESGQRVNRGQGRLDLSGPQPMERWKNMERTKGSSMPASVLVKKTEEEDDEEMEHDTRPKTISSRYIRGPPISKSQKAGAAKGQTKSKPVYVEDEECEEDKGNTRRSRPVLSQYIRGPPISKPQSEQKTSTQTKRRVKETVLVTSRPQVNHGQSYPRGGITLTKSKLGQMQNYFGEEDFRWTPGEEHCYMEADGWEKFNHDQTDHAEWEGNGSIDPRHQADPSKLKPDWGYPLCFSGLVVFIFLFLAFIFTLIDGSD